jgi:hypothetical protein
MVLVRVYYVYKPFLQNSTWQRYYEAEYKIWRGLIKSNNKVAIVN